MRIDVACPTSTARRTGTGVIVSERHVLTAAHVVDCPVVPTVRVTYAEGRKRLRMVVTRQDRRADVARLEIADAGRFGLGIHPPVLRMPDPGNDVCATLALVGHPSTTCGVVASEWTVAKNMQTDPGDSGAPVYCDQGTLVGLVIRSGESSLGRPYTRVTAIDPSWIRDLTSH